MMMDRIISAIPAAAQLNITHSCEKWSLQVWQCTWCGCAHHGGRALLPARVVNQMAGVSNVGLSELTLEVTSQRDVLRKGASVTVNRIWQARSDSVWPGNRACACARARSGPHMPTQTCSKHTLGHCCGKVGTSRGTFRCLLLSFWHVCVCAHAQSKHTHTQTHNAPTSCASSQGQNKVIWACERQVA